VGVLRVIEAHAGGVTGVAFHSNGTQALTGGADKTVKLWDLNTGKVVRDYGTLAGPVRAVAFSRDFTQVGAAAGKTVKVWNATDGKELLTLNQPAEVNGLSFNGDKGRIATANADNRARVWDVATKQELQAFLHAGPVRGVVFHTNNSNVVTASADKTVAVQTLTAVRVLNGGTPVRGLAVTPNGSHVLTAGADKKVKLWNATTGAAEARVLEGAEKDVRAVAVSKNNVLVAVGGADQSVRLYTFADGKLVGSPIKATGAVNSLAFSPNNQTLVAACADKTIQTWNVAFNAGQPPPADFGKPLQSYSHAGAAADAVFAPDSVTIYSGGADKTVKAWKLAAAGPTKNFGHPNLVDAVAFNPTGTQLATGCHDGKVRIFEVAKGAVVREINAHVQPKAEPVYCVAWSSDGKQVLSGSNDHSMKLWDAASGNLVREFKAYKEKDFEKGHRDGVFCVAFSPDGKTIASGSSDRSIKLWNVADGTVARELINPKLKAAPGAGPQSHPGWVYGLRFTADGKRLISVGGAPRNHGFLGLWEVSDGKLLHGEELAVGPIHSVALSPDGKFVALGTGGTGRPAGSEPNRSYVIKMPEGK
jgi:WD40 repeat protein